MLLTDHHLDKLEYDLRVKQGERNARFHRQATQPIAARGLQTLGTLLITVGEKLQAEKPAPVRNQPLIS